MDSLLSKHGVKALAGAVLLLGLFVRFYGLERQGLHCEELFTIPAATGQHYVYLKSQDALKLDSFPRSRLEFTTLVTPKPEHGLREVTGVLRRNVHMPLYFYFMHYWIGLTGVSEWWLRFPSVVFGALAVLMMFLLGKELLGPFVGLAGALLVALMPEQIFYAQEARMYSLLVLLVTSSTYVLALALKRPRSAPLYVLYAALSIAGLYTHYGYVFCFAFQTLFVWAEAFGRGERKPPWRWLITQGCVAASIAPWLVVGLSQRQASPEMLAWARADSSPESVLSAIALSMTRVIAVPEISFGWLSVAAAYALLTLGVVALRPRRRVLLLLCLWVIVPVAGITLLDVAFGTEAVGVVRYWMVVTPALYLLIAAGLHRLVLMPQLNHRLARAGVVGVVGLLLCAAAFRTASGELRSKPDRYQELARVIDNYSLGQGGDAVFTEGSNAIALALGYYSRRDIRVLRAAYVMEKLKGQSIGEVFEGANIWLVASGDSQAKVFLERSGYRLVNQPVRFGHIVLYGYAAPAGGPAQRPATDASMHHQ